MPTMKEYQSRLIAPGWLQDPVGKAWLESFGSEKDSLAALAKLAVKARFPGFRPGHGPRTNALVYSQQLEVQTGTGMNAGQNVWQRSPGVTVTGNSGLAPDGTQTASLVAFDGSQADQIILQALGYTTRRDGGGNPYWSYLKADIGQWWTASIWLAADQPCTILIGNNLWTFPEPSTTLCNLTPTWTRFTIASRASAVVIPQLTIQTPSPYTTPVTFKAWGAMLEKGTWLNAYLPTTEWPLEDVISDEDIFAAEDAVGAVGRERGIDRGRLEPEASYRMRVQKAWDVWRWAGTPYGLLLALYWAGYTPKSGRVLLQVQKGFQYELRPDFDPAKHGPSDAVFVSQLPGTIHLGGSPELWSQFAVLITRPWPTHWGSSTSPPADGSDEQKEIAALVGRWKPAHAKCVRLQVQGDGPVVGSSLTVGSFTIGGSGVTTWTPPSN